MFTTTALSHQLWVPWYFPIYISEGFCHFHSWSIMLLSPQNLTNTVCEILGVFSTSLVHFTFAPPRYMSVYTKCYNCKTSCIWLIPEYSARVSYPGPGLLLRRGGYDITRLSQIHTSQYEKLSSIMDRLCPRGLFDVCARPRRKEY